MFKVHRDAVQFGDSGLAFSMWMPIRKIKSNPLVIADPRMFADEKYVTTTRAKYCPEN